MYTELCRRNLAKLVLLFLSNHLKQILKVAFILYGPHPWITPADKVHMDMHNEGHEDHHDDLDDDHHHIDAMTNMVEEHMGAEHMDTMFAVLFFAWHIAFAMGAISLLAYLIHK